MQTYAWISSTDRREVMVRASSINEARTRALDHRMGVGCEVETLQREVRDYMPTALRDDERSTLLLTGINDLFAEIRERGAERNDG